MALTTTPVAGGQTSPDGQAYDAVTPIRELQALVPAAAGTAEASKLAVLGANKNLDTLVLPTSGLKIGSGAGTAMDRTAAQLNALAQGVAAGYRVARGVAAVTGTATVVTGLATVVAVIATPQDDPDGVALAAVSATIGDQNGAPAAGSVVLKAWKVTATGNATLIAATAAKNVNWVAIGT